MTKKYIPTIAVDFDGVIAPLSDAGTWNYILEGIKPINGARAALRALIDTGGFHIVIFTARAHNMSGKADVMDWLNLHDIPFHYVTATKIPALLYIDDRAVRFENWSQAMVEVSKLDVIQALSGPDTQN